MRSAAVALAGLAGLLACEPLEEARTLPELDRHYFRCNVEPVLAARCAFLACHGNETRPFHVYARGRLRLDVPPELIVDQALTMEESLANFDMAQGLAVDERLANSLLLLKPMDVESSGFYHGATKRFADEDVFLNPSDRGFAKLENWLEKGAQSERECIPSDDVGI